MFYLPIRILTRPVEVLSQAHDYNIVCIRRSFLLQINIRSTTCLAWSLYDYRLRKMVGTIHFGTAIWRHLGGAGPNAPTCSFQLTLSVPTASHLRVTGTLLEKRDRRLFQPRMLALRQTNLDPSMGDLETLLADANPALLGCSSQICIRFDL